VNSNKGARRGTGAGRVRIIAGEFRGRRLGVSERPGLRPTPDRVRETLFNWLGQSLDGFACLDLFAGSGALGFEAASRGAARVVMVESDRATFISLQDARESLRATRVELVLGEALEYLSRGSGRFDVVFLDPPFRQNALAAVLHALPPRLSPGARIYVEAAAAVEPGSGWAEVKRSRAGQVSYQLLQWKGDGAR
jgi:16S rRNA (guanine966-N2)-methyltransferase